MFNLNDLPIVEQTKQAVDFAKKACRMELLAYGYHADIISVSTGAITGRIIVTLNNGYVLTYSDAFKAASEFGDLLKFGVKAGNENFIGCYRRYDIVFPCAVDVSVPMKDIKHMLLCGYIQTNMIRNSEIYKFFQFLGLKGLAQ